MTEPTQPPIITKELLRELGDWRVDKEGRQLAEAGRVQNLSYTDGLLSGTVGNINARLKLGNGKFDIENQCGCRQARVDGIICPHVVALVYAYLNKDVARPVVVPQKPVTPTFPRVTGSPT